MSDNPLEQRPAIMHLNEEAWVPKKWADQLVEALREKQRSDQSHRHQFAEINNLFNNLPARHAQAPYAKSAEAFRKHGLIATGHCDVETIAFDNKALAIAAAPLIAKLARKAEGYALVVVRDALVVCSTPHSQSYKAMGKDMFEQSKADVLRWAEELLGVR